MPLESDLIAEDILQRTRARATDAAVADSRRQPNPASLSRSARRLSVAELNDADADQLPGLIAKSRIDSRPTIIKALDLIDLPRNTAANIAAGSPTVGGVAGSLAASAGVGASVGFLFGGPPGAAVGAGVGAGATAALEGIAGLARAVVPSAGVERLSKSEKATLGQPRISGSDILKELGVENRIVRAVGGFAGDVAFDPLTWVGAPGFGTSVKTGVGKGAAAFAFRKEATSAIKGAARAASLGESVKNAPLRSIIEESGFTPERLAAMRAEGKSQKDIQGEILNELYPRVRPGPMGRALEMVGAEKQVDEGALTRYFLHQDRPDDQLAPFLRAQGIDPTTEAMANYRREAKIGQASREFYSQYGKGTRSIRSIGLKEGETGSEVLHVPFTDISLLQVPAFSKEAKSSATLMRAARGIGPLSSSMPEAVDAIRFADTIVQGAHATEGLRTRHAEELAALAREREAMIARGENTQLHDLRAADVRQSYRDTTAAAVRKMRADADEVSAAVAKAKPETLGDAVALSKAKEIAELAARRAESIVAEGWSDELLKGVDAATRDAAAQADRAMKTIDDIVALQERVKREVQYVDNEGRARVVMVGDSVGTPSYFRGDVRGRNLIAADPSVRHEVSEKVSAIIGRMKQLDSHAGFQQDELFTGRATHDVTSSAADELNDLRRRLYDETAPLRDGPQVTIDEARDAIVNHESSMIRDQLRSLLDAPPEQREAAEAALTARAASINAALDLASALEVPFASIAGHPERALAEFAATELGTNDLTTGASALSAIAKSMRRTNGTDALPASIADSMDRGVRSAFGRRSGEQNLQRRMFEASIGPGRREAFTRAAEVYSRRLAAIAKEYGVADDQGGELFSLGLALAIRRLEKSEQAFHSGVIVGKNDSRVKIIPVTKYLENPEAYPDAHETFHVLLERSMRGGLLQNERLRGALEEAVGDVEPLLRELGDMALDSDLLGVAIDAYMPLVVTKEGRALLRSIKSGVGRGNALSAEEAFQKARSTEQYLFRDAEGNMRRFFEWQRSSIGRWSDAEIEAAAGADSAAKAAFEDIRDAVQQYERLPNRPAPMHTDPFELNSLIRNGMFSALTGSGQDADKFFSTNLAEVIGSRAAQHRTAMSRRQFNEYAAKSGMMVRADKLREVANAPGARFTLPNRVEVTILPPISGQPAFRLGKANYRLLNPPSTGVENPLWSAAAGEKLGGMAFEENLADMIERAASVYEPQNVNRILDAWDRFLGIWRTTTLLHPSWMFNDAMGNLLLWVSNGLPVDRALSFFPKAWRMLGADQKDARFVFNDGRTLGRDAVQLGFDNAAIGATQIDEIAAQVVSRDILGLADIFEKPPTTPGERIAQIAKWPQSALNAVKDPKKLPKKFSEAVMRQVVSPWFRLNHRLNTSMRLAMFAALIEKGNDPATAGRMIREAMYDFTDMTAFESRKLRRLVPFASWVRSNIGRQIAMLGERPVIAATYPKVIRAADEAINGDAVVPDGERPQWLRDQLALQIGEDPDNRFAVLLRSVIPTGDAYEAIAPITGPQGVMDFMRYFGSNLAPVVRSVGELAAGREFFTGRTIGADATKGDVGLVEYGLSQFRPFREFGVGSTRKSPVVKSFEQGPISGASRLALGGRAQAFDEERRRSGLLRDYQDSERGLRLAINRLERNDINSTRERAKLMALYRQMQEVGLGDEVPKWARAQLEAMSVQNP